MIKISGHNINPAHVLAVHTVSGGKKDRHYQIEIIMTSGYKFLDYGRGSDSIVEAEDWADTLAKHISNEVRRELVEITLATIKAAGASSES